MAWIDIYKEYKGLKNALCIHCYLRDFCRLKDKKFCFGFQYYCEEGVKDERRFYNADQN